VRELPTGTVTFLFTDVEGSTRLLHELGDAYADALGEHRKALRECFGRHGGVEVDTQGDAFFVAFAKASDALAAAVDGKAALEPGAIRVRMGDLGHHRLRDLTAPERIYQFGDEDLPPLRSLNTTNLPVASNPLVGRETELAELTAMLTDSERLVTLTGPGGSGKTRLGLQVGAELLEAFPGGVFFVPLAALSRSRARPACNFANHGRSPARRAGRPPGTASESSRSLSSATRGLRGRSDLGRRRDLCGIRPRWSVAA
jgi:hypothetical protein